MIRKLAKKLTAFAEFAGFVIIELEFRLGTFQAGAEILKAHSSMALIQVRSKEAELLVKMIRPRKVIRAAGGSRIQFTKNIWRVFTASEVLAFVEDVGDKNQIHCLNPPIVPGLLILEILCAEFFEAQSIKLKFKNFITAGEPLTLQATENNLEIICAGVRKVLISIV